MLDGINPPLFLVGRRNFLVRALGFVAAPAAAGAMASVPAPTISPDLVSKLEAWRAAFHDYEVSYALLHLRGPDGRYVHPMMNQRGLTAFGERYHADKDREDAARESMLQTILDTARPQHA